MKKIITAVFSMTFILLVFVVFAQDPTVRGVGVNPQNKIKPKSGKTYALIIGINYSDRNMYSRLNFAVSDAELMKTFLQSGLFFDSIPNDNIKIIRDKEATSIKIWYGVDWLKKSAQKGDRVIIYFAGHGIASGPSRAYLIGYDAPDVSDPSQFGVQGGAYPVYELKTDIEELKARNVSTYLITDACRNNEKKDDSQLNFQNIIEANKGEIQFSSCSRNQSSMEDKKWGGGHGLFTYYLVKGLSGYADDESDVKDGVVTLSEIKSYVEKHVRNDSRNLITNEIKQMPYININNADDQEQPLAYMRPGIKMKDEFQEGNLLAVVTRGMNDDTSALIKNYFIALQKKRFFPEEADNAYNLLLQIKNKETESRYNDAMQEYVINLVNDAQIRVNKYFEGIDSNYTSRYFATGARELNIALSYMSKEHPLYRPYDINRRFMEALSLRNTSYSELAIAKLDSAIALDSTISYLYYARGLFEKDKDKLNPALGYFRKAHQLKLDWSFPLNQMGSCLQMLRQFNEAKKVYIEARNRDTTNAESWNYLGTFYDDRNMNDSAIYCFQKAIKINPNYLNAIYNLGIIYEELNQDDKAKKMFWRAVQVDPSNSLSWGNLSWFFWARRKYDSAIAYFNEAIEADPTYAYAYRSIASIYDDLGQDEKARAMYQRAINADSSNIDNWNNLGKFFEHRGLDDSAIYCYKKSFEIDPGNLYALKHTVSLYKKLNQEERIKQLYVRAVEVDPTSARYWNNLGYYFQPIETDSAIYYYQKALSIEPNYVASLSNLADLYKGYYEDDMAKKYYYETINADSTDPVSWHYLAIFYESRKMYDSAIICYNKSFQVDPYYTTGLDDLASLYTSQKKDDLAKKTYWRMIQSNPKNAVNWNAMGMYLYNNSKFDSARYYYQQAVKLDPYAPEYYYNLGLVCQYREPPKLDSAKYFFKKVMNADNFYFASYNKLATIFSAENKLDSAIYYLRAGLWLDSNNETLIKRTASVYFDHEKFDSCFTYMKKLYSGSSLFDRFNPPLDYKDSTELLKYFKAVLRMTHDYDSLLYMKLGNVYYDSDKYDSAFYYYQKGFNHFSDGVDVYYKIARIYDKHFGDVEKAYGYYTDFFKRSYDLPNSYDNSSSSSPDKRTETIKFIDEYLWNKKQFKEYTVFYKYIVTQNMIAENYGTSYFDKLVKGFSSLNQTDSVEIYSRIKELVGSKVNAHLIDSGKYYLTLKDPATAVKFLREGYNQQVFVKKYFANYRIDTSIVAPLTLAYLKLEKRDSADWLVKNYLLPAIDNDYYYDYQSGKTEQYFALTCYYATKNDKTNALRFLKNYFNEISNSKIALERVEREELLKNLSQQPEYLKLIKNLSDDAGDRPDKDDLF